MSEALDLEAFGTIVIVQTIYGKKEIGGIIIPETAKLEQTTEGMVVEVGPDVTRVNIGDKVLYGKYAGKVVPRNGEDFVVMDEADLISKIKK